MPQNAIFIEGTTSFLSQEFSINAGTDSLKLKKALIKIIECGSDQLHLVVGFGRSGMEKLGAVVPDGLREFKALYGVGELKMPSTQTDVFIWVHSHSKSEIFDFTLKSEELLSQFLTLEIKQEGFRYHDSRGLTGFVDGSANPKGDKRKPEVLIGSDEVHQNGSFAITQKWVHDLKSFHSNKVETQEQIIGRTKEDSIELEGDAMPANSHVSRVDVKVGGEAMKMHRRSFPFASDAEKGLFFLGFAKNIDRIDVLLKSKRKLTCLGKTNGIKKTLLLGLG
jgi:putative iron-dependent peroxidase